MLGQLRRITVLFVFWFLADLPISPAVLQND
jgi:hypothetical protein